MTLSESGSEILGKFVFLKKLEKAHNQRKFWISCKQCILYKAVKRDNSNKNCFSPQSKLNTAKLCFPVVLKHFWGNSLKNSLFSQKMTISERSTEILRKFVFLNKFEKEKILRKIWNCLNNCF